MSSDLRDFLVVKHDSKTLALPDHRKARIVFCKHSAPILTYYSYTEFQRADEVLPAHFQEDSISECIPQCHCIADDRHALEFRLPSSWNDRNQ